MNILIFGSTGSIGLYIFNQYKLKNYNVIGTTSKKENINDNIIFVDNNNLENLLILNNIDIIVWTHGYNFSDNIETFDSNKFIEIININVLFIIKSLNYLLNNNKINNNCKMVIVSSIWEELTRSNKLSYTVSKSALSGLVKSLAYDLSKYNILINNVLPGVIDNEMSKKMLTEEQRLNVKNYLQFNRMINLDDVFNTIFFLTTSNTGITGQSIKVDLGFTNIKKI